MKILGILIALAALLLPAAGYGQTEIISGLAATDSTTFQIQMNPLPPFIAGPGFRLNPVGVHLAGVFLRVHILDPSEVDSVTVFNANPGGFPFSAIATTGLGAIRPGPSTVTGASASTTRWFAIWIPPTPATASGVAGPVSPTPAFSIRVHVTGTNQFDDSAKDLQVFTGPILHAPSPGLTVPNNFPRWPAFRGRTPMIKTTTTLPPTPVAVPSSAFWGFKQGGEEVGT